MPSTLQPARTPRRRRTAVAVAALAGLAIVVPVGWGIADGVSGAVDRLTTPPAEQTIDRSPVPLLLAMRDIAQYHAATGSFQVLVDVEKDTAYVPSVISGERTTFFAAGTVDARVDFSALGPESVTVSPDRRSASITLPAPVLAPAVIDPAQSRVVARERGVAERIGDAVGNGAGDDGELYRLAATKLDAAAAQSDLTDRAATNTRAMLTGLAQSLGYETVTVTFAPPAVP